MYDVIVVGAGPAGSTAARELRKHKVSVLLLDKASFPREKACGGGMPTRVWKRYPFIEGLLDAKSYGFQMYSSSLRYKLGIVRETPLIGTVVRHAFDAELLRMAVDAGVEFRAQTAVVDMQVHKDGVKVTLQSGEVVEAKMVFGCDGFSSVVAKKAGLSFPEDLRCVSLVAEHPLSEAEVEALYSKQRVVHLFIKVQGIAGYGWVFPKKCGVSIGLGEFSSAVRSSGCRRGLKETYAGFLESLRGLGLLPEGFCEDEVKGAVLPIFPLKKTFGDRVLVCGDAAGFINPITGEGIYYAMVSGELAAGVACEALRGGDFSSSFLRRYQRRWWRDFGRDLKALGGFNGEWGRDSERLMRRMASDTTLTKLTIGVAGGQISFARYRGVLILRYVWVSLKDVVRPRRDK